MMKKSLIALFVMSLMMPLSGAWADKGGKPADPASKGQKNGWVNGMPPGQAKKQNGEQHAHAEAEADASAEVQPMTTEEALREIAKDEAVRASGVAEGSAEEALIRVGTDILIDRSK